MYYCVNINVFLHAFVFELSPVFYNEERREYTVYYYVGTVGTFVAFFSGLDSVIKVNLGGQVVKMEMTISNIYHHYKL